MTIWERNRLNKLQEHIMKAASRRAERYGLKDKFQYFFPRQVRPSVKIKHDQSQELLLKPHLSFVYNSHNREGLTFSDRREDVQTGPAHDWLAFHIPGQHLQARD